MPDPITILLVDDHPLVRKGVHGFLGTQPDILVVAEAGTGQEAVHLASEYAPDVVLMDLLMPEMDGVETTRQVLTVSPRTRVIVLTSYHEDEQIFSAIRAGALSYLLKDIEPAELATAVRKAAAGEAILHPSIAARVVQEMHDRYTGTPTPLHELSEREREVLRLVAEGMSNGEIASRLNISLKTVKSHVSNILSKLHLADRTQVAIYAWREGIVHRE